MRQGSVTAEAAAFAAGLQYTDLPPDVVRIARRSILDGIAVTLAGTEHQTLAVIRRHIEQLGGHPHARLFGDTTTRAPVHLAALWQGVAGHVLDWDDTQLAEGPNRVYGQLTHPTVPVFSAGLAVAEWFDGLDGRSFLAGFTAGFEVECKLAAAIHPSHYVDGFHTSGTIGTFGATACAGRLLGLTSSQMTQALGIAASMASGVRANFGSMTKALHVGRAAENGVRAALLAQGGYTADSAALDGHWGYLSVAAKHPPSLELIHGRFGNPYSMLVPGVSTKPYPSGVLTHPSMDALLHLLEDEEIDVPDIARIRLHAGSNVLAPIRFTRATNELQAKFCFPFLLACIAMCRSAGKSQFTPEFIQRADVQELQARVHVVRDPDIEALGVDRILSKVVVETRDGRVVERRADECYRGGPEWPLTDDELKAKLRDAAAGLLDSRRVDALGDFIATLETHADVTRILELVDGTEQ